MNKNTCIYVVTHKNINKKIKSKGYYYIAVGNNKHLIKCDFYDDDGINIAKKNTNYCELTAQYYIWNNSNCDIVGLMHYRRFLYKNVFSFIFNKPLSETFINCKLNEYDVILPQKYKLKDNNVYSSYCSEHYEEDLKNVGKIISKLYPDYQSAFESLKNINSYSGCNMIITSKKIYHDYSKWLFDILFELEKNTDLTKYDDYQRRIYGFLAERLLNVYFIKNNHLKIYYCKMRMLPEYNTFFERIKMTKFNINKMFHK